MTKLENILQNIGLNEKESKIYLSCLEIGAASVNQIAKIAKINRVTAYDILEKMLKKGLVSQSIKNETKIFEATDPETIVHEFDQKVKNLHDSLRDLKRLKGDIPAPKIRYYEGLDGIKAIYEDTLHSKSEILNFANASEIYKYWPTYTEEYVKRRVEKKIYLRGITPDDETGKIVVSQNKNNYREIKLVDDSKYNFPNEINIYDTKVAIISFNETTPLGIIIDDASIAETQRAIFQIIWDLV